jgi:putative endonuclease
MSGLQDGTKPSGRRAFGQQVEQIAASWLQEKGLQLLQCNFHCRVGEIDLIMRDELMLVFVEVRYRRGPLESVTYRKRCSLLRCARFFLATQGDPDIPWRFDVLGICPRPAVSHTGHLDFNWVRNAFGDR